LRAENKIQPKKGIPIMKTIRFLVLILAAAATITARADTYSWSNLQSDIAGAALHTDRDLVNPWGLAASSGGTIWAADNGTGVATLYRQDGSKNPLVVTIPARDRDKGKDNEVGNPTGVVFNSTNSFKVTRNGNSQPARFIFVSEDGTISGWNPALDGTHAMVAIDKDDGKHAVYKGAALGVANGHNFLYVNNFHSGRVETYDENFRPVNPNGFIDPNLPAGYAPFGIHNLNGQIYVTFALQDSKKHDEVAGPGNGFVDAFDTSGNLLRRVVSNGNLNAPWGLALVNGELWVGNFGDGRINNYDPTTGAFLETLSRADGTPLQFDGLWDLLPLGNGVYFTAGIADEAHGLFGIITED
jgi:uncharacterized protein (TIGR03118 family)